MTNDDSINLEVLRKIIVHLPGADEEAQEFKSDNTDSFSSHILQKDSFMCPLHPIFN